MSDSIISRQSVDIVVVGAGPAGVILAYLLARNGIRVHLIESQRDFDRDFRGDTIHPSTLDLMDQLGLAQRILQIPHGKIQDFSIQTDEGRVEIADLKKWDHAHNYIAMMPQSKFLAAMVEAAEAYPHFSIEMQALGKELIRENGQVRGLIYKTPEGLKAVDCQLVAACDGRSSGLRKNSGLEMISAQQVMDVLWFRLPKAEGDGEGLIGQLRQNHLWVQLDRGTDWQMGYIIFKGSYRALRERGFDAFCQEVGDFAPQYRARVEALGSWREIAYLPVGSRHCPRWYQSGFILLGDAAHVMSPIGGVGINYAIQDAIVAANRLIAPLKKGRLQDKHLAAIQRRRYLPVRLIQMLQNFAQKQLIARALTAKKAFKLPFLMRSGIMQYIMPRLLSKGVYPVHYRGD